MKVGALSTKRRLVAAGCGLAVAGTLVTVALWPNAAHPRPDAAALAPRPAAPASSASTSSAAPAAAPRRRVAPHEYVAPAVPRAFKLMGPGFTIKAHVCAMPAVFPLSPGGDEHHTVCWVDDGFGVRPGSRTATSYILGHSWAADPQEVLNRASTVATRDVLRAKPYRLDGELIYPARSLLGARITLRTPEGTLGYVVRRSFGVDKLRLGSIERIMNQRIPRRIVIITCAQRHGVDYEYNIVLEARLVSSRAAAHDSTA